MTLGPSRVAHGGLRASAARPIDEGKDLVVEQFERGEHRGVRYHPSVVIRSLSPRNQRQHVAADRRIVHVAADTAAEQKASDGIREGCSHGIHKHARIQPDQALDAQQRPPDALPEQSENGIHPGFKKNSAGDIDNFDPLAIQLEPKPLLRFCQNLLLACLVPGVHRYQTRPVFLQQRLNGTPQHALSPSSIIAVRMKETFGLRSVDSNRSSSKQRNVLPITFFLLLDLITTPATTNTNTNTNTAMTITTTTDNTIFVINIVIVAPAIVAADPNVSTAMACEMGEGSNHRPHSQFLPSSPNLNIYPSPYPRDTPPHPNNPHLL
eukprot:750076-Hanusia_phi.AAC.3